MSEHIDVKRSEPSVARLIAATFPGYRGRKVRIVPHGSVTLHTLNWCGGSRNEYRTVLLDGMRSLRPDDHAQLNSVAPWYNTAEGHTVQLTGGFAVVEHCVFCGKDLGLRIHVAPSDLSPTIGMK